MLFSHHLKAQLLKTEVTFTRADSLRGALSDERSCFDVIFYDLDLRVDTATKSISGVNRIFFKVTERTKRLQLDLFDNMKIRKVILDDTLEVPFTREFNAFFIDLKTPLAIDSKHTLTVSYGGSPVTGKMLPWDGGFNWTTDDEGNAWIVVACQGRGASLWWPLKDHQSDEPDSMRISISVPDGLTEVSNGRLRSKTPLRGGYTRYEWFVSYPINSYNVTVNIGKYAKFYDLYINGADTITLDYYVMPYNLDKAKKQFEEVKSMLKCFGQYFGKYPFQRDGYKLVESPYYGMEHQSCIAYGNQYRKSASFDYIIIHESAHEWWGNAVSTKDIGDMWIHEGFGTYAEVLYVECMNDSAKAGAYANGLKKRIKNDVPVIGPYDVNSEGSGDMYPKGALLLNTLRHVLNNDAEWFSIIRGIQEKFSYVTTTSADIEQYISFRFGRDLSTVFNQYLRTTDIPVLEVRLTDKKDPTMMEYRWTKTVPGFNMPLIINPSENNSAYITPADTWNKSRISQPLVDVFKKTGLLFYINVHIDLEHE